MFSGYRRVLVLVFGTVFLLIMFIGLLSGVTLKACLGRAFLAGMSFSVLLWVLFRLIGKYALPLPDARESLFAQSHDVGGQLDFTVSDPLDEFSPINAKQIDPDLERVINNDPERMAEIIKKMGNDE
ncbi:hypothetical protein [Phosphitispora sp. TUW77]|uniref:hypothetical protein n=1 Tax=Phosphitispora sp. TUW77 TaxID=3152361 RepID=UPI003AB5AFED